MARTFSKVFESNPQLQAMNDAQRMELLDKVYGKLEGSGKLSEGKLKNFRDAQEQTLYDYDMQGKEQASSFDQWRMEQQGPVTKGGITSGRFGVPFALPEVSKERSEMLDQMQKRNLKADIRALGKVATDFSHYPKAVAKFATDIGTLGGAIGSATGQAIVGNNFLDALSFEMKNPPKIASEVSKWYDEAIKDDPEMYKLYDAAVTDALLGVPFGLARATKAAKLVPKLSGIDRVRQVMSPVVSNVVGGQVIYKGIEQVDKALEKTELSEEAKSGIRLATLLGGGILSGIKLEPIIERAISGDSKLIQSAIKLSKSVQRVKEGGMSFQEDLARNPDISEDAKAILEVATGQEVGSKFDPATAAAQLDEAMQAQAKFDIGEELTLEEASSFKHLVDPDTVPPDIDKKFSALDELQRRKVLGETSSIKSMVEDDASMIVRGEDEVNLLGRVLEGREGRLFEPSDTLTTTVKGDDGDQATLINGGYVEGKYPELARVLAKRNPESLNANAFSPDQVLALSQSLVARSGFGMDQQAYSLQRELLRESFELWDEVKDKLKVETAQSPLSDLIVKNSKMFKLNKKQAANVSTALEEALPELKIAYKHDVAMPKGVSALSDAISRTISVGSDATGLRELTHEIGHLYFHYGLDSGQKLSWMDDMRRSANTEEDWAAAFPGYSERYSALASTEEISRFDAAKQAFWLYNPAEMYAEQFSSFMLSNVIPSVDTLSTMGRVQKSIRGIAKSAADNFDNLTPETRSFFIKSIAQPDVDDVQKVGSAEIDQLIEGSWLYSDRDTAILRNDEITRELEYTYGGRSVSVEEMPSADVELAATQGAIAQADTIPFSQISPAQRVMMYTMQDLPRVMEAQALRLLYDLPDASMDELVMASKRLDEILLDKNRPELIERLVSSRLAPVSKYDPNFNPAVMQRTDPADLMQMRRDERAIMFNRLDKEAQAEVTKDEARKARVRFAKAREIVQNALASSDRKVSKKEVDELTRRVLAGNAGTQAEGDLIADLAEAGITSVGERWESIRSSVVQELAAMDTEVEALKQFSNAVMAKKGMAEFIDPTFRERMSYAEAFAQASENGFAGLSPMSSLSLMARLGYCGMAGLEYDPEGTYLPFVGTVRWNPAKFFSTPLNAIMIPGLPSLGGKLFRKGKAPLARQVNKLPQKITNPLRNITKVVARNFGPNMGFEPDLIDKLSQAKIYGASRKQDWLEFAETMQRHFTEKERKNIARIVSKEAGWKGLTKWAETRPDIQFAVKATQNMYSDIAKRFRELGVDSEHFSDLEGSYVNRFYANLDRKSLNAIFESYNISPLRGDFLKRRGVPYTLKNMNDDGIRNDAFTKLMEEIENSGVTLEEGTKINGYMGYGGNAIFTVPGSAYDLSLKKAFKGKSHTWDKLHGGFVVEKVGTKSLGLRRDFTKEERKIMGEVMDISVRAAAMSEQLERDYRKAYLFDAISKHGGVIDISKEFTEIPGIEGLRDAQTAKLFAETNNYKLVPSTVDEKTGLLKYGALAGKYLDQDTWEAILSQESSLLSKALNRKVNDNNSFIAALKAHRSLLTGWKLIRTAYSPVGHVNNFVSNVAMGYLLGHNVMAEMKDGYGIMRVRNMELRARKLYKEGKAQESIAIREQMEKDPYYAAYREVREARMADSSMWASELNTEDMVKNLMEKANGEGEKAGFYAGLKHGLMDVHKAVGRTYEGGDLLFKMGAFSQARKSGKTPSEALRYAYEAYFDYGQLAPGIRFLRDSGLIPFVSYMYKSIPALAKAAIEHPGRLATVAIALEAIHLATIGAVYGTDEPLSVSESLDEASPSYMQGKGFGGLIRTRVHVGGGLRETNRGGEVQSSRFLDLSRMLPGGDLFETTAGSANESDFSFAGAGNLVRSFLTQSPVLSQAITLATGENLGLQRSLNTGGQIDTEPVKARVRDEFLKGFYNSIVPNLPFIPYTYSYDNLMDSLTGAGVVSPEVSGRTGLDSLGVAKPLSTGLASQVGIKLRDVYPDIYLTKKTMSENRELNKELGRLKSLLASPRTPERDKEEEKASFRESLRAIKEKQSKRGELMRRLRENRQRESGGQTLAR